MTDLLVITGLSGAGRSTAADVLEDLGWFVIDNLPTPLIPKVAELAASPASTHDRIALAVGVADAAEELLAELADVQESGTRVRLLFLDAGTDVLVRRYESTRRRHPRSLDVGLLAEAIEQERSQLSRLKEEADLIIDTSTLNVHQFRERLVRLLGDDTADLGLHLTLLSFGFKHGLPTDVDMVLDCRFLPNPYWQEDLRPLTGQDEPVRRYVLDQPATASFIDKVEALLGELLPQFEAEGKSYLTVAFGCTGGHHRSVAIAEEVGRRLVAHGSVPAVHHRDIKK